MLTHDVNNLDGEEKAVTSDGVLRTHRASMRMASQYRPLMLLKVFNYKDGVGLGVLSEYTLQNEDILSVFLTVPATYRKESV